MRYIILKNKVSDSEIVSRQEYLFDVFKIYTIPYFVNGTTVLKSIPEKECDIVFVNGHNDQVFFYLCKNIPAEKNIILITCYIGLITTVQIKNKNIYFTDTITEKIDGPQYGFNFEIAKAELNLYNCNKYSIYDKINFSFERVK